MNAVYALAQAAHFLCLMLLFGGGVFALLLKRQAGAVPPGAFTRNEQLGLVAAALVLTLLSFFHTAAAMSGEGLFRLTPGVTHRVLFDTRFGYMAAVQFALLLGLLAILLLWHRAVQVWCAVVGGLSLAALAVTSHAAAAIAVGGAVDAVHLLAAGFWIGGLAVLLRIVMRDKGGEGRLHVLRTFSLWGTLAVAVLLMAGIGNAMIILLPAEGAPSYSWLTLLGFKLVLAAFMIALALTNRLSLVPRMAEGDAEADQTLVWSMTAEIVLGVIVVILAGFLGLSSPMAG